MRSMLAPWIGGASAPQAPTTTGGTRSMLAFWMGGACSLGTTPPTPIVPTGSGGGGGFLLGGKIEKDKNHKRREDFDSPWDDEEILEICAMIAPLL